MCHMCSHLQDVIDMYLFFHFVEYTCAFILVYEHFFFCSDEIVYPQTDTPPTPGTRHSWTHLHQS